MLTSLTLAAAAALTSIANGDWMRLILSLLCIAVLVTPAVRRMGFYYRRPLVWSTMLPSALMVGVHLLALMLPIRDVYFLDMPVYSYLKAVVLAIQSYVLGLMVALIIDWKGVVRMDMTWVGLFAMVLSVCLSALDLVFTFWELYRLGYPVFNQDFTEGDDIVTNRMLMCSPLVTTFVTLALMLMWYQLTRGRSPSDMIETAPGVDDPDPSPPMDEATDERPGRLWAVVTNVASTMASVALFACALTGAAGNATVTTLFSAIVALVPPTLGALRLVRVPPALTVMIDLAVVLHCYGLIAGAYGFTGAYDVLTHTVSSMTVGLCVFYTLMCFQVYSRGRLGFTGGGLAAFTGVITMAFSTYWEVMEFFSDIITGGHAQYSPYDTLSDILCDILGMGLAALMVDLALRRWTIPQLVATFRLDERVKSRLAKSERELGRCRSPPGDRK